MPNYDLQRQYQSETERIRIKCAHDEHKIEFREMCAQMILDAQQDTIRRAKEETLQEIQAQNKQETKYEEREWKNNSHQKTPKVDVKVDTDNIIDQIRKAIKKAFR